MSRRVRSFLPGDLPAIRALGHAAVDDGDHPDSTHADVDHDTDRIPADPQRTLVSLAGDVVAGFIVPRHNELLVGRRFRRQGHGTVLLEAALPVARAAGEPYVLLYVPPGDTPGLRFARARGMAYRASLHWMERPAGVPVAAPDWPPDVVTRTFDPARDDIAAYVALLNAAFADHPTPLAWTEGSVRLVHGLPGFDPSGILLVAPRDDRDRPVGFVKTSVEAGQDGPFGEIGLVGILPAWRGRGLGRALLRWGIARLVGLGLPTVGLAVTAANARALALYEAHGFVAKMVYPQWSRDA